MNLDLGPEERSLLELVRTIASRLETDADEAAWWAALHDTGLLDIDVRTANGAVHAAVVAEALGEAVAPVAYAARMTATAVAGSAAPSDARDRLRASFTTTPGRVSGPAVGYQRDPGEAYVEAIGGIAQLALVHTTAGWALVDVHAAQQQQSSDWESAPTTATLRYDVGAATPLDVPGPDWNELNIGLHSAELVGVVREAIKRTSTYLTQREQFGRPIGSFQALQHRIVDVVADLRACEGMTEYALWQWAGGSATGPDLWIRAAAGLVAEASVKALRECFQFHGGIAMTEEFWVHRWLRRGTRLATFQGVPSAHFRTVGARIRSGAALEVPLAAV